MQTIEKNTIKGFGSGTVSNKVKSRDNDPFIVKKVEDAVKTLQRVGLPKSKKNDKT